MRFLFVDQILKRDSPRYISGLKHITPDDFFLCSSQDSERLSFIPSLIGEAIGQLAAWQVMHEQHFQRRPVAGVVAQAGMYRPAYVGDTLFLECEIDGLDEVAVQYHGRATVNGELVFSVDGAIGPMLPMSQFIDEALVRQQFLEIDRPIETEVAPYLQSLSDYPEPLVAAKAYLMTFDGLLAIHPKESCRAFKKISRSSAYFADHFPNKPVLPLTILLECHRQLALSFLKQSSWQHFRLIRMERIKMSEFVQPGEVIETELIVKKYSETELVLHCRTFAQQKRVCVVDLVFQTEV
jgi:3-hydroxymyristoyl/3-hydroxydecanoyl-(acyl carrier protein) dehydratase